MEIGYPGGYFLAVDLAQRVIVVMQQYPELRHVLRHEAGVVGQPLGKLMRPELPTCAMAPLSVCFAVQPRKDVMKAAEPGGDGAPARLARDMARFLVLYVKKRPHLVHAFFAHECRATDRLKQVWAKCGFCSWRPKESARCDYCGVGACTVCVSETSYQPCGQGCCRLCVSCHPLVMNETCDVPGCTRLRCTNQSPVGCQDHHCWKRLCAPHSLKGGHECDGKRRRTEPGDSE